MSSSILIISWRQREASNVALPFHSFVRVLQSKFLECDANSYVGSIGSSLAAPPVIKAMRHGNKTSLKSLGDAQLDTLPNLIDQQVETRILHLKRY